MKKKYFYGLLFFIVLLFASCSSHVNELEPNNSFDAAQSVRVPSSIKGKINNGIDNDIYKFEILEKSCLSFSINSLKGFDTALKVFNEKQVEIATADDFYKNFGEAIPNLCFDPGIYFIKLLPGSNDHKIGRPVVIASDDYYLDIKVWNKNDFSQKLILEREPNDFLKDSQKMNPGEIIKGFYYPFLDYKAKEKSVKEILKLVQEKSRKEFIDKNLDIYQFVISDKGDYLLQLSLSPVENFDPVVIVAEERFLDYLSMPLEVKPSVPVNERGTFFIVDSNSFDKGEGLANYKIKGGRKYYIFLACLSRLDYIELPTVLQRPYHLSYNLLPLTSDMESEPNDQLENPKIIENNVMKGFLNPIWDKDFYLLEGSADSFYRLNFQKDSVNPQITKIFKMLSITLIPPKDLDLALSVYDEYGRMLKMIDNEGKGGVEKIPNFLAELGNKLYFSVSAGKQNESDDYLNPYEIKFFFTEQGSDSFEYEPNDQALVNQGPNTFSDTVRGYLNHKEDIDHFYAIGESVGKYHFYLKGLPKATFVIEIYDSNGYFIKKAVAKAPGEDVLLEHFITRREVFRIKVYTAEKNYYNINDAYSLSIYKAVK